MLNFRFHIVSLVAVFLALAIGIIMGSTVIDRALVDTLEDQQQSLRADLDDLSEENGELRRELGDLREGGERLASEGGERLLSGTLADVPVLVVAVRGVDTAVLDDLGALLETAGSVEQGTLWLTDRFALGDEEAVADLAEVLGLDPSAPVEQLRVAAAQQVAAAIGRAVARPAGTTGGAPPSDGAGAPSEPGAPVPVEPPEEPPTTVAAGAAGVDVLVGLREAGFVEYDAPEGASDDVADLAVPGSRVVLVSGTTADVPDATLAVPLAVALVAPQADGAPAADLLVAEGQAPVGEADEDEEEERRPGAVELLRDDDVGDRLSTVDNLDAFAGRVAAIVSLQDLGSGRRGHYGVGPGAQRLVPAPAE